MVSISRWILEIPDSEADCQALSTSRKAVLSVCHAARYSYFRSVMAFANLFNILTFYVRYLRPHVNHILTYTSFFS